MKIFLTATVAAACCFAARADAQIVLSPPADVPSNVSARDAKKLAEERKTLVIQYHAVQAQIDRQAQECHDVEDGSPKVDQCIAEAQAVRAAVSEYRTDAKNFSTAIAETKVTDSGDPMVVDARNVPSGLPRSVEDAIAGAYGNAPQGVSDRVRKGFQAVMTLDWPVAKAWFEDALNHDPGNAGLRQLVAFTTYSATQSPKAAPASQQTPHDTHAKPDPIPNPETDQLMDQIFDLYYTDYVPQHPELRDGQLAAAAKVPEHGKGTGLDHLLKLMAPPATPKRPTSVTSPRD